MLELAQALGSPAQGRFIYIPASKGDGYLTGFSWGSELRMMVRRYYLKEEVRLALVDMPERREEVVFVLSGIFSPAEPPAAQVRPEPASVLIYQHAASAVITMPPNTAFNSVIIAVSRPYLRQLFGEIDHPLVSNLLEGNDHFAFETGVSANMVQTASDLLQPPVPESLASPYYQSKCHELLCCTFALLLQRDAVPPSKMHLADIKAVYALKLRLQSSFDQAPNLVALAQEAGMSRTKLRNLFKQTFGMGMFDYYQARRIQEAARLLKEQRLTVSEVGYRLGFTNLSHFSRVFEQHVGLKPKKYSAL